MKKLLSVFAVFLFAVIIMSGCSKSDDASVTPSTDGNRYPNAPSNPTPSNGQVNVARFGIVLQWTCSDPDANDTLKYDIKYGNTSNPSNVLVTNAPNPSADLGIADTNQTIFWKVTAKDNHGLTKDGPVWSFTTGH
jgi:hypothetical protein